MRKTANRKRELAQPDKFFACVWEKGRYVFIEVQAEVLQLETHEDLDLFVHPAVAPETGFVVTEGQTGKRITGYWSSKERAIEDASYELGRRPPRQIEYLIERMLAGGLLSPRYREVTEETL